MPNKGEDKNGSRDRPVWLRVWNSKFPCVKLKRCLYWSRGRLLEPFLSCSGQMSSSAAPPCALLLPCRGGGPASQEEGELCQQAGDRAGLAGEAAGAQPAASVVTVHIKNEAQSGCGVQQCVCVSRSRSTQQGEGDCHGIDNSQLRSLLFSLLLVPGLATC